MSTCLLQLGRAGDIINILGAIPLIQKKHGRITLMVSRDYADLMEGFSGCDVEVFNGPFQNINDAFCEARRKFKTVLISQVYGHNYGVEKKTDSFCKESWRLVQQLDEFGKHPVIFDRRDFKRELKLVSRFPMDRPWILVNSNANSSPFQGAELVFNAICERFKDRFHILNLGLFRAERFYDLLALYDRATCLVTVDTGTMHLARASKVPVISMVTDNPTLWHGAVPPPNSVFNVRYGQTLTKVTEILEIIGALPIKEHAHFPRRIFHVYSKMNVNGETGRRNAFAESTWNLEYNKANWVPVPILDEQLPRSSKAVGDSRGVPFIKDLVDKASEMAQDDDLIVLTNQDTCFSVGLTEAILCEMKHVPAFSAHRHDFKHRLFEFYTPLEAIRGNWYCGCDLFCFTKGWWVANRDRYPDMFLGTEAFDWILRELIKLTGGSEWHGGMLYHEAHNAFWNHPSNKNSNPAQVHNKRVAIQFLKQHKLPLNEFS